MPDAVSSSYASRLPWSGERPDTLVVTCSDGRWRPHIEDFLANGLNLPPTFDLIEVPGGAEPLALLDLIPKDFNFFRRRLEMLVEAHSIRRVLLIAHENCGWYKERKLGPMKVDLKSRQLADLRRAKLKVREWFDDVPVETYYARLEGQPPRAVFDAV
jgi:hypothetical protein